MGDNEKKEIHLDVYLDRQELHMSNVVKTYYEGMQSAAAKQRYEKIKKTLSTDFVRDNSRTKINPTDSRFSLDLWDFSFYPFL